MTRHPEEGETKRRPGSDVTLSPPSKGTADDPTSTVLGAKASARKPVAAEVSPVLAVVVVYTASADEAAAAAPTVGGLYPLRAGESFFAGKAPAPRRIAFEDGTEIEVDHAHLFARDFEYVSRRHLTIRMRPDGRATLIEHSANGTYLVHAGLHVIRGEGKEYEAVALSGREILVLGVDHADAESAALRPQLELIPLIREADERPGAE